MQFHYSVLLAGLALTLVACTPSAALQPTPDAASSSSSADMQYSSSARSPVPAVSSSASAKTRIIQVTTDNFTFTPSSISVKKGEKVTIRLTGVAGIHGFAIRELGINATVDPGKTVDVVLPTDTAGTFTFFCTVPCGPGHKDMKGTLVIE